MSGRGARRIALLDPGDFTPRYDAELAEALIRDGCDVQLFGAAVGREAAPAPYRREHFYQVLARSPRSKGGARLLKGLSHAPDMARLPRALREFGAEVLHCQWTPLPLLDRWALRWVHRRFPVVITVHDSNPYNGASGAMMRLGYRELLREADAVIVHTRHAADRLAVWGLDRARIHQLPHGLLDLTKGCGGEKPLSSQPSRLSLLQFGKIKFYKGVDVLLRAVALLPPAARDRLEVQIVGQPYIDTAPLLGFVAQHGLGGTVRFRFEFVDEAELARLLCETDALALPYREIDASGVAMAAVASGLPVIATTVEGFTELFAGQGGARLVPPEDPEALAAVLSEWIEDPGVLAELRTAMQVRRDQVPTWDEIARATRAVYAEAEGRWSTVTSERYKFGMQRVPQ